MARIADFLEKVTSDEDFEEKFGQVTRVPKKVMKGSGSTKTSRT